MIPDTKRVITRHDVTAFELRLLALDRAACACVRWHRLAHELGYLDLIGRKFAADVTGFDAARALERRLGTLFPEAVTLGRRFVATRDPAVFTTLDAMCGVALVVAYDTVMRACAPRGDVTEHGRDTVRVFEERCRDRLLEELQDG